VPGSNSSSYCSRPTTLPGTPGTRASTTLTRNARGWPRSNARTGG
jgi:hypothetical protein